MTKYYRDANGNYLGAFDIPPDDGIEADDAPSDARQMWDGVSSWLPLPDAPEDGHVDQD